MGKSDIPSRDQFRSALERGYDWNERLDLVEQVVHYVLMDLKPGKIFRNGQLAEAVLDVYDLNIVGEPVVTPLRKPLSQAITALGKLDRNADLISLGRTIKCGRDRYARERLWSFKPDVRVATPRAYEQIEQGYDPPLDNDTISRHPRDGYEPVTCGHCAGTGKVYKRKEQKND